MTRKASRRKVIAISVGCALSGALAGIEVALAQGKALFPNASFEELASIPITSVSRKTQSAFTTPAAVYVITEDEIRRSGARNLPEALRLAPGVEVARITPHRYAVGIRGFNNEFTTKLLVLQDGRSLYTPLFSGTFWDMQDTLIEDIDHIEVIRGPGGTAWGVNAVNGVINIVTKSAHDTRGLAITAGGGNEERGFGSIRYGGGVDDGTSYRVFLQSAVRDAGALPDGSDAGDGWRQTRGGFRVDSQLSNVDTLTAHGEAYAGTADEVAFGQPSDVDVHGEYVLGKYEHGSPTGRHFSAQAYYDASHRRTYQGVSERRDLALDVIQRLPIGRWHDVTIGGHYRDSRNKTVTQPGLDFNPTTRNLDYAGAFIDDAVHLLAERLTVSVGLKWEHNNFTGTEVLPNARLLWTPQDHHAIWASYSHGARLQSIADHDSSAFVPAQGGQPAVRTLANPNLPAELVDTYELGWRFNDQRRWSTDIAVFRSDYDRLRTRESMFVAAPPTLVRTRNSKLCGESFGFEAAFAYQATRIWRIKGHVSFLDVDLTLDPGSTDMTATAEVGVSPRWQGSLRNTLALARAWELEVDYRYVDQLAGLDVPTYHDLDVRLAWQASDSLQIAAVLQNLAAPERVEFQASPFQARGSLVERGAHLAVRWER